MILSKQNIISLLESVNDPEVPVINIVELGVVRDVTIGDETFEVKITPTYSGCPAMKVIEDDIEQVLKANGYNNFTIKTIFAPVWTTDWMSEVTKQKLKDYGIAPPDKVSPIDHSPFLPLEKKILPCPFCDSKDTFLKSQFGSTACKALYFCNSCAQPFEHFKCI